MYTSSAPRTLRWSICCSLWFSEHICVCVKTWSYVGVCLINCESMWETVCLFIWVRVREKEEKIRFQPPSSRQSAPILSVPQTLDRETGPETDRTPNKYV